MPILHIRFYFMLEIIHGEKKKKYKADIFMLKRWGKLPFSGSEFYRLHEISFVS